MHDRVILFLASGAASLSRLSQADKCLLERRDAKRLSITRAVLAQLLRDDLVVLSAGRLGLTVAGAARAKRQMSGDDPFQNQHRDLSVEHLVGEQERRTATVNNNESPLANLARRKDKSGVPFLHDREFRAGERLRCDYSRGQIMPRLGANWEASIASRRRDGGGMADLTVSAIAARRRVEAAVGAVGPELAGILIDVCCFLKGLEVVEVERGWPVRSAKIVLKAALSALSRHYEPEPPAIHRHLHWGAADYRPAAAL